jgi:hypothetical protein
MDKYSQGSNVQLDAYFYDREGGILVDPDGYPDTEPTIDVIDQLGVVKVNAELISQPFVNGKGRISQGHYSYKYTLANNAPLGNQWRFKWNATINGVVLSESERTEYFEVVPAGHIDFNGVVTPADVRALLECYGIDSTVLSDTWIENRIKNFIGPWVQRVTRMSFGGTTQVSEYYSGNGSSTLILNRRPLISVDEIFLVSYNDVDTRLGIGNVVLLKDEGILKAVGVFENYPYISIFPKGQNNVKITYTYGFATPPNEIKEAMTNFCAEQALGLIGNRTGGGDLTTQGYNRQYGSRGKYTIIRNDLARQGHALIQPYITRVIGA